MADIVPIDSFVSTQRRFELGQELIAIRGGEGNRHRRVNGRLPLAATVMTLTLSAAVREANAFGRKPFFRDPPARRWL